MDRKGRDAGSDPRLRPDDCASGAVGGFVSFLPQRQALPTLAAGLAAGASAAGAADIYGEPPGPLAARVYGTAIYTADAEKLRYVVLQRLTRCYAAATGIKVTPPEQQAYAQRVQQGLRNDREQQLARRDELQRKLAAGGLSEAQRKSARSELDTVNQTLAELAADDGAPSAEEWQARAQIAVAFVLQWKINRALY